MISLKSSRSPARRKVAGYAELEICQMVCQVVESQIISHMDKRETFHSKATLAVICHYQRFSFIFSLGSFCQMIFDPNMTKKKKKKKKPFMLDEDGGEGMGGEEAKEVEAKEAEPEAGDDKELDLDDDDSRKKG